MRSPRDGYTLLVVSDANAYSATLYDNLKFNFALDITPVASIERVAFVMVVNPSFAANTVPGFIANAKANPGKINMATLGPGSPSQLFGVLFKAMAGVDLVTVNYRGIGPALVDLLSGRVEVIFTSIASTIDLIMSGKPRSLAVTTAKRMDVLPDVPTIRAAGRGELPVNQGYHGDRHAGSGATVAPLASGSVSGHFRGRVVAPDRKALSYSRVGLRLDRTITEYEAVGSAAMEKTEGQQRLD